MPWFIFYLYKWPINRKFSERQSIDVWYSEVILATSINWRLVLGGSKQKKNKTLILGYLDNVNKGKLRMTASGRFWMLTSTSLIFLVRPTTAMLMKIWSRKTTSFRATLRTMRMKGTFRGPLRTIIRPSSTTLDPKLMSPVGLGTSWTSQSWYRFSHFFSINVSGAD